MTPITRIRDEVQSLVSSELLSEYSGGVPMPIGQLKQNERAAPPRVAWVPGPAEDGLSQTTALELPSIGTIIQRVNLHCWASDFDKAWTLAMSVRRSIKKAARDSAVLRGHRWLTQEEAAWLELGEACLLAVDFLIPLTARPTPTAKVESFGHTTGFVGSDDNPCSS